MARKTRRRFRARSTRKRRIYGGKIVDITPTTLAEIPKQCHILLRGMIKQSSESDNTNTVNRDYIVIPGLTVNLETLGQRETDNNTVEYKVFYITRDVKKYFTLVSEVGNALQTLYKSPDATDDDSILVRGTAITKVDSKLFYRKMYHISREDQLNISTKVTTLFNAYMLPITETDDVPNEDYLLSTIDIYVRNDSMQRMVQRIIASQTSSKIKKNIQTMQHSAVNLQKKYADTVLNRCVEWQNTFIKKNDAWNKTTHKEGEKLLYYAGLSAHTEYFILHYLEQKYRMCMLPPLMIDLTDGIHVQFGDASILAQLWKNPNNGNINWVSRTGVKNMVDCILSGNKTISIISLTYLSNLYGHANMLIYYHAKNIIEWFEPHGQFFMRDTDGSVYNKITKPVTNVIEEIVRNINDELKTHGKEPMQFIIPSIACPRIRGLQRAENQQEIGSIMSQDGYCGIWSFMVAELSLSFPTLTLEHIQELMLSFNEQSKFNLMHVMLGFLLTIYDNIDNSGIISTMFEHTSYPNLKTMRDIDELFIQDPGIINTIIVNYITGNFISNTPRVALTEKMPEMTQPRGERHKKSVMGKIRRLVGR